MKFVLFAEGKTEKSVLNEFLKRWLDARLETKVGIQLVKFDGWRELVKKTPKKAELYLTETDVIGVIALLDLYGPDFYPNNLDNADEKYEWAKKALEKKVEHANFRQFFAVHETEAWLLSDSKIFPQEIRSEKDLFSKKPEDVNSDYPPAKRLDALYEKHFRKRYKKITYGSQLFKKLDPEKVYSKCPRFREMMDEMLGMAKTAGA